MTGRKSYFDKITALRRHRNRLSFREKMELKAEKLRDKLEDKKQKINDKMKGTL